MKKTLSLFLAVLMLSLTVLATPVAASAKQQNQAKFDVTEKVYADAYLLINLDDDEFPVIAAKHPDKKKYPASLTKIVTAIVTLNHVKDLKAKTKVSQSAILALANTGAQVAGLQPGEELTIEQLLYLTMVHSACDACEVLAEYVAGSIPGFVQMMNDWAQSIGCENTHFVNPDGLHSPEHYTTAQDMATITLEALKNEDFVRFATTQKYEYGKYTFIHTNYMLDKFHITYYYEYAEGIKTGSTTEAGYCVITKASKDGYNYLAVVMDAPIKKLDGIDTKCSFIDAATLFDWAFDSLKYSTVIHRKDLVDEVPVENGKDADTVGLVASKDVTTLVPGAFDESLLVIRPVDAPEQLEAPVLQGERVCKAEVMYAHKVIATVNLEAAETVELSTMLKVKNAIADIFGRKTVFIIAVVLAVLVLIYMLFYIKKNREHKKKVDEKRRLRQERDDEINRRYYGD